jgi:hypothetical protein
MTLHFTQIFFTDARTFMLFAAFPQKAVSCQLLACSCPANFPASLPSHAQEANS